MASGLKKFAKNAYNKAVDAKAYDLANGKDYKELQPLREALDANLETHEVWLHEKVLAKIAQYDKAIADDMSAKKVIDYGQVKSLSDKVAKAKETAKEETGKIDVTIAPNRNNYTPFYIALLVAFLLLVALVLVLIFK